MTPLIERARKHFTHLRFIDVPEWPDDEGKPTRLFWQAVSLDAVRRARAASDMASGDDIDVQLRLLVSHAENGAGEKLFSVTDIPVLRNSIDGAVLGRILQTMTGVLPVEILEKN